MKGVVRVSRVVLVTRIVPAAFRGSGPLGAGGSHGRRRLLAAERAGILPAICFALLGYFALAGCAPSRESRSDAPGATPEVSPQQADRLIRERRDDPSFVILDVRTPAEFAEERLDGAGNLDFHSPQFRTMLPQLDRERTYLVYCRSGNRSGQSLAQFRQLGFKNVRHLHGGIRAWKAAGLPVVNGPPTPASP